MRGLAAAPPTPCNKLPQPLPLLLAGLSPAPGAPASLRRAGPASCFQAQNLTDCPPLMEASKGSPPAAQWGQLWGLGEPRASTGPQAADSRRRPCQQRAELAGILH